MTTVEILKAARELISDPARWTQEATSRDKEGRDNRSVFADNSVSWCAFGALEKFAGGHQRYMEIYSLLRDCAEGEYGVVDTNDELGHAAVLELYDRAIALAEKEAAQ